MTSLSATVPKLSRDPDATSLPEPFLSGRIAQTQHRSWPRQLLEQRQEMVCVLGPVPCLVQNPSSLCFSLTCQLPIARLMKALQELINGYTCSSEE